MIVIGVAGGIASGKSQVTQLLQELGAAGLDADRVGHQVLTRDDVKARVVELWGEKMLSADGEINRKALAEIVFSERSVAQTNPMRQHEFRAAKDQIDNAGSSELQSGMSASEADPFQTSKSLTDESKSIDANNAEQTESDSSDESVYETLETENGLSSRDDSKTVDDLSDLEKLEAITHPLIGQAIEKQIREFERQSVVAAVLDAPVMFKAGWDRVCSFVIFVDCPREVRLARATQRGWDEAHFDARERLQMPVAEKRARSQVVIDNAGSLSELKRQVNEIWQTRVAFPQDSTRLNETSKND